MRSLTGTHSLALSRLLANREVASTNSATEHADRFSNIHPFLQKHFAKGAKVGPVKE